MRNKYQTIGGLIAKLLATSWRPFPDPLLFSSDDLAQASPRLLASGGAALAWWRLRSSELSTSPSGCELHNAYKLYSLLSLKREHDMAQILGLLAGEGIEPIVVKGWTLARIYPDPALRPFGDIDLCIKPSEYGRAEACVTRLGNSDYNIDLHRGFEKLDDRSWDEMYSRSFTIGFGSMNVRILAPEDHLRVICFHFLREGAWRPLWLCDIAAAIETRPDGFDWDLLLRGQSVRSNWLACAISLAHVLLNAKAEGLPAAITKAMLPGWLVRTVLTAWGKATMQERYSTPMREVWQRPIKTLRGLRSHWPNAIEGTVGVGGPFNELPRFPFQIANSALRSLDYVRKLPRSFGMERPS